MEMPSVRACMRLGPLRNLASKAKVTWRVMVKLGDVYFASETLTLHEQVNYEAELWKKYYTSGHGNLTTVSCNLVR